MLSRQLCALAFLLAGCTQDAVHYDKDTEVYRHEVCFVYLHPAKRMYVPCPNSQEDLLK
jgi:hypothetical protein